MFRLGIALVALLTVCVVADSEGSPQSLSVLVYQDGLAHVSAQFDADPLNPVYELDLLGLAVDNFVATDEDDTLLSAEFREGKVALDIFDSRTILVEYDVHDLISKAGRIWTFALNSTQDYTLLMPKDAVIVGIDTIPKTFEVVDERTRLGLGAGPVEINYIMSPTRTVAPVGEGDEAGGQVDLEEEGGIAPAALIGIPIAAGLVGVFLAIRIRTKRSRASPQAAMARAVAKPPEPEAIFSLVPDMREEDREIIRYICESGGEMLESHLRKKLLQPRTTMWRAVKRLERMGVVEVAKRDAQNLVRIRNNPGEMQ